MNPTPADHCHERSDVSHRAWPAGALSRPRWQHGEEVAGWVTAEITPYPRPLAALDAPFEAQFVLAAIEYPSGLASQWGNLHWRAVDVIMRSDRAWPVVVDGDCAPQRTPELQKLVDDLARQAQSRGWEPAGRGRTWCSLRFRKPYAQLRSQLQWR